MIRLPALGVAATVIATAALAHQGVMNPAVKERMDLMVKIGAATKVLGEMAKGETEFNASVAQEAALRIAEHSEQVPALFEAREDDPKSEALPAIWENFADFTAKSEDMQTVAAGVFIESRADLREALGQIGGTCKSCHESYRK